MKTSITFRGEIEKFVQRVNKKTNYEKFLIFLVMSELVKILSLSEIHC